MGSRFLAVTQPFVGQLGWRFSRETIINWDYYLGDCYLSIVDDKLGVWHFLSTIFIFWVTKSKLAH